jgi:dUTP pyrophosphatase
MEIKYLDERLKDFKFAPSTDLSAGYDLRACIPDILHIYPNETKKIKTGISLHMADLLNETKDDDYNVLPCAIIMPRSSLGCKGLKPRNSPGLIDADYQGEIVICMHNYSDDRLEIKPMERIAQLVFMVAIHPVIKEVSEFSTETERGDSGFGSTGTH